MTGVGVCGGVTHSNDAAADNGGVGWTSGGFETISSSALVTVVSSD